MDDGRVMNRWYFFVDVIDNLNDYNDDDDDGEKRWCVYSTIN